MGQIIGGTIPLVYFLRKNSSSLRLRRPKWDGGALRRACTNGVSELMSSISMSIVGMLYNAQLMRYAGENGVAAYGTIMYVDFIFLAIFIGYATGVAPVISYHYGAGNKKELNNLLKRSVLLIAAASLSMLLLSEVMAAPLAAIFVGYDAGLLDMTGTCVFHLCGFVLILRFLHFQFRLFTALGDGLTSALIAFLRTLVFESASVIILPLLLGLNGIWGAIIVAECMSVTVSVIFLVAKRKRYQYF
ncbi:MAG: MATE family efflux transporter [Clostridium fessum]